MGKFVKLGSTSTSVTHGVLIKPLTYFFGHQFLFSHLLFAESFSQIQLAELQAKKWHFTIFSFQQFKF